MDEQQAAKVVSDPGIGSSIALILTGAGGYLAKHLWDRRRSPRAPQGPTIHELLANISDRMEVMQTKIEVRAIQAARMEERMATKDDVHDLERMLTSQINTAMSQHTENHAPKAA